MLARQIVVGLGIAAIFPWLIYYGLSSFYPPPRTQGVPAPPPPPSATPEERKAHAEEQQKNETLSIRPPDRLHACCSA
jgi:hypothetical protein